MIRSTRAIPALVHGAVWTWLEQLLQLGEIITCIACLTTQLVLIQRCALIEIGGLSLALRGPDGSAQKALHYMRLEVKRHQRMMVRGIQFLAMTIVLLLLKDLPLPLSVIPAIIATGPPRPRPAPILSAQGGHRFATGSSAE